jgi:hypothetical protein
MAIYADWFGSTLEMGVEFYSRNDEGDLFLHGNLSLFTNEAEIYDPPVLYLDLPLVEGKTWDVVSRLYDNMELTGEGEPEHYKMRVVGWDTVISKAGSFPAWKVTCDVIEGNGMGTDWFAPGKGHLKFTMGQGGPLMKAVDFSTESLESLKGVGDPVKLDFHWQPGTRIEVKKFATKIKDRNSISDTTMVSFEYTYEINRVPNGLLVHMTDLDLNLPPGGFPLGAVTGPGLVGRIGKAIPDFLISREGAFAGLIGAESSLEATLELIAESLADVDMGDLNSDELLQTMGEVMTPEVLEGFAAEEWNKLIGVWIGFEGLTGILYEGTMSVPVPIFQGVEIPLDFLVGIVEPCPCNDQSKEKNCVQLTYTSRTDAEAASEAVMELMKRFPAEELLEIGMDNVDVRTSIMAIMEPENMRLHEVYFTKRVNVEVSIQDGEKDPGRQVETEHYFFTYPD